jgi:hypothetical protein
MVKSIQDTFGNALLLADSIGNANNDSRMINNKQIKLAGSNNTKGISSKYKRLSKYRWGIGIEHEVQLFHNPYIKGDDDSYNKDVDYNNKIIDFIVFDSLIPTIKLLNDTDISVLDREFLDNIPFEASGRKCSGEYVLEKVPVGMPEFVTTKPFSSLSYKPRKIEDYCNEIFMQEQRFIKIIKQNQHALGQINKYGKLIAFPFGMSNYIKVPTESSRTAKTYKYKKQLYEDYTGSYHITLTLPYEKNKQNNKKYQKEFINNHQQFANQFQWLEPLLVVGFFSSDLKSMGTTESRIRGSFRLMRTGWGNLATSNVRKFKDGIGRYADIDAHWRQGLEFKNLDKLKHCNKVSIPEPGAVSALGANFRTFGSTDPARPWHRESGVGMTIPNGIEIRIFDHFPSKYLPELSRIVIYIAENSRTHKTNRYVYENKDWIKAVQEVMKSGWHAVLPIGYVNELRNNLGLKINTKSLMACDILEAVNIELFKKNCNGDYSYLMLNKYKANQPPIIPYINKGSWEYGFLIKLNRENKLNKDFFKFLKSLPINEKLTVCKFTKLFFEHFDSKLWKNNILDIMFFLQAHNVLDKQLKIKAININKLAFNLPILLHKPFLQSIKPNPKNKKLLKQLHKDLNLPFTNL